MPPTLIQVIGGGLSGCEAAWQIAERGIKTLPQSLAEAISELKNDAVVRAGLGVIADEFIELKTREWESYDRQVTPWEVNQYLTFF